MYYHLTESYTLYCYLVLSFGRPQLYKLGALPFTYGQYVVIELADKLYNYFTVFLFLCFAKVCLSHRLKAGTERGLGALQHSLWPDVYEFCVSP